MYFYGFIWVFGFEGLYEGSCIIFFYFQRVIQGFGFDIINYFIVDLYNKLNIVLIIFEIVY